MATGGVVWCEVVVVVVVVVVVGSGWGRGSVDGARGWG